MIEKIKEATAYIQAICPQKPEAGVILGTGLGALVHKVENQTVINYSDIPHFPVSTVETHSGKLIFGQLGGKSVVVMQGRFHYYEGYSMQEVVFPVRVMKLLGIRRLLVSNAAGGLNPDHEISDLMIINDHINLQPENPLVGKNIDEIGGRFPDMSEPYCLDTIEKAKKLAAAAGIKTHEGVYASVPGPNLETRAEYKYLRLIGADAVGMSTVPEVIAARHADIPVFAVSVITDLCSPGKVKKVSIPEIIAAAMKAEPALARLMEMLIAEG